MPTQQTQTTEKKRRRRIGAPWRFAIAGVAVLGISGALTTAVWTANVVFQSEADVTALTVGGRIADETGVALTVDMSEFFGTVMPGTTIEVPIELVNGSDEDVVFDLPEISPVAGTSLPGAVDILSGDAVLGAVGTNWSGLVAAPTGGETESVEPLTIRLVVPDNATPSEGSITVTFPVNPAS